MASKKTVFLLIIAAGIEAIWLLSLRIQPWNKNIEFFLVLFAAAFALYLLSWITIEKNSAKWNLGIIIVSGLIFRATVFFAQPTLSDDIYRYVWDGRVQAAGINPYKHAPDDPALENLRDESHELINHRSIKTIYPPLSQMVFRLCATVHPSPASVRLFFMGCDVALLLLLLMYLKFKKQPLERLIIYAWNPLVIIEISSSGHLDILAVLLFFSALFAWETGHARWSGTLAGLGFLAKFSTVLLIPWILVKRQSRRILPLMAVTIGMGTLFYWPDIVLGISQTSGLVTYAKHWYFNASFYAILSTIIPVSGFTIKISLGIVVAVIGFVLARRINEVEILKYGGLMWAAILVLSPVVYPWYVIGLIPFLCFYPRWSGLVFTGLVASSYLVLKDYAVSGVWQLPAWVPWVEYGIPGLILLKEIKRSVRL